MLFADEEKTIENTDFTNRILTEAEDLGLVDEKGQILNERKKANFSTEIKRVKITKQQKVSKLTQRTAMLIGKEKNDPDYKKWQKHRAMAEKYRLKLEKKFASKAKSKVREALTGSGDDSSKSAADLGANVEKRKV